jgi:hypothetical protein
MNLKDTENSNGVVEEDAKKSGRQSGVDFGQKIGQTLD